LNAICSTDIQSWRNPAKLESADDPALRHKRCQR
jgi:hypothetical protein